MKNRTKSQREKIKAMLLSAVNQISDATVHELYSVMQTSGPIRFLNCGITNETSGYDDKTFAQFERKLKQSQQLTSSNVEEVL